MSVTRVSKRLSKLGEGPHWDVHTQRLYHVDVDTEDVCLLDPVTGETESVRLDGIASFVIPYRSDPSHLLTTCTRQVRKLNFNTGQSELLAEISHDNPKYRLNDGKCDSRGLLWTGTMIIDEMEKAHLFKMDRSYKLQLVEDKISLSNGFAWSMDDKTMYYIDSTAKLIHVFDYDLENGTATNKRTLIDYNKDADYKDLGKHAVPDGMTIDVDGKLWVAHYGGGCLLQIDPETKSVLRKVEIPAKNVTSCCFGGPLFDILYVTTAEGSEEDGLPEAGAVFAVTGHGTKGLPPNNFAA